MNTKRWVICVVVAVIVVVLGALPPMIKAESNLVIHPAPGDLSEVEGVWPSTDFAGKVAGQDVFIYGTEMGWSFVSFDTDAATEVEINVASPIKTVQVRPVSYQIAVTQTGSTLRFVMPPNKQVVVQVNTNLKLLIASDPLEEHPISGPSENVVYFGSGVHHVGEDYAPAGLKDGDTIYIAGGAVVEGLFSIHDVRNLTIRGRGVVAMGEWRWVAPEGRPGMALRPNCDGLRIEGLTFVKSPGWQLSVGDSDATVQRVKLLGVGNWYNSDGLQTWGDNHHTTIEDSFIFARDDALNINAGSHDFHARNLVLWNDDNGASVMLGWGGRHDSSNILVEDSIVLENSSRSTGVFSARWGDETPHTVSKVTFRNIVIENAVTFVDMLIAVSDWNNGARGRFEDIAFIDITTPVANGIMLGSSAEDNFNRITFSNVTVNGKLLTSPKELDIFRRNVFDLVVRNDE